MTGGPDNWDRSSWTNVKPALLSRNALMNLPYIEDDGVFVAQSNACLLHLGRKFKLNGANEQEVRFVLSFFTKAMMSDSLRGERILTTCHCH